MRCERVQELLSDYYEDSIQAALRVPLESHLAGCTSCKRDLDGLHQLWPVLDSAPVVEPPAGFRANVWQRIDSLEDAKRDRRKPVRSFDWRSLFPRPALGWAVAVAAVVVLSRVVVPGAYTQARLWLPFSSFSSGSQQNQPAPQVVVGEPRIFDENGKQTLKLRIQNPENQAVHVDVRVESGSVDLNRPDITAPAGSNGWFVLGSVKPGGAPVRVSTSWHRTN